MAVLQRVRAHRRSACSWLRRAAWGAAGRVIGTIPPRDLTVTRLGVTRVRIQAYWTEHGRLPAALSDLPATPGRDNSTVDGWGRPIRYEATGAATVKLSSAGADRSPGATDQERDLVVTFDARVPGDAGDGISSD